MNKKRNSNAINKDTQQNSEQLGDESTESILIEDRVKKLLDIGNDVERRNIFNNAEQNLPKDPIRRSIITRTLKNRATMISSTPMLKQRGNVFSTESSLNISPIHVDVDVTIDNEVQNLQGQGEPKITEQDIVIVDSSENDLDATKGSNEVKTYKTRGMRKYLTKDSQQQNKKGNISLDKEKGSEPNSEIGMESVAKDNNSVKEKMENITKRKSPGRKKNDKSGSKLQSESKKNDIDFEQSKDERSAKRTIKKSTSEDITDSKYSKSNTSISMMLRSMNVTEKSINKNASCPVSKGRQSLPLTPIEEANDNHFDNTEKLLTSTKTTKCSHEPNSINDNSTLVSEKSLNTKKVIGGQTPTSSIEVIKSPHKKISTCTESPNIMTMSVRLEKLPSDTPVIKCSNQNVKMTEEITSKIPILRSRSKSRENVEKRDPLPKAQSSRTIHFPSMEKSLSEEKKIPPKPAPRRKKLKRKETSTSQTINKNNPGNNTSSTNNLKKDKEMPTKMVKNIGTSINVESVPHEVAHSEQNGPAKCFKDISTSTHSGKENNINVPYKVAHSEQNGPGKCLKDMSTSTDPGKENNINVPHKVAHSEQNGPGKCLKDMSTSTHLGKENTIDVPHKVAHSEQNGPGKCLKDMSTSTHPGIENDINVLHKVAHSEQNGPGMCLRHISTSTYPGKENNINMDKMFTDSSESSDENKKKKCQQFDNLISRLTTHHKQVQTSLNVVSDPPLQNTSSNDTCMKTQTQTEELDNRNIDKVDKEIMCVSDAEQSSSGFSDHSSILQIVEEYQTRLYGDTEMEEENRLFASLPREQEYFTSSDDENELCLETSKDVPWRFEPPLIRNSNRFSVKLNFINNTQKILEGNQVADESCDIVTEIKKKRQDYTRESQRMNTAECAKSGDRRQLSSDRVFFYPHGKDTDDEETPDAVSNIQADISSDEPTLTDDLIDKNIPESPTKLSAKIEKRYLVYTPKRSREQRTNHLDLQRSVGSTEEQTNCRTSTRSQHRLTLDTSKLAAIKSPLAPESTKHTPGTQNPSVNINYDENNTIRKNTKSCVLKIKTIPSEVSTAENNVVPLEPVANESAMPEITPLQNDQTPNVNRHNSKTRNPIKQKQPLERSQFKHRPISSDSGVEEEPTVHAVGPRIEIVHPNEETLRNQLGTREVELPDATVQKKQTKAVKISSVEYLGPIVPNYAGVPTADNVSRQNLLPDENVIGGVDEKTPTKHSIHHDYSSSRSSRKQPVKIANNPQEEPVFKVPKTNPRKQNQKRTTKVAGGMETDNVNETSQDNTQGESVSQVSKTIIRKQSLQRKTVVADNMETPDGHTQNNPQGVPNLKVPKTNNRKQQERLTLMGDITPLSNVPNEALSEGTRKSGRARRQPVHRYQIYTCEILSDKKSRSSVSTKKTQKKVTRESEENEADSPTRTLRKRVTSKSLSKSSRSPSKRSRTPSKRSRSPSKRSRTPSKRSRTPSKRSRSPSKRSRSPSKRSRSPSERSSSPSKRSRSPSKRSKSPSKVLKSPSKVSKLTSKLQSKESKLPSKRLEKRVDQIASSNDGAEQLESCVERDSEANYLRLPGTSDSASSLHQDTMQMSVLNRNTMDEIYHNTTKESVIKRNYKMKYDSALSETVSSSTANLEANDTAGIASAGLEETQGLKGTTRKSTRYATTSTVSKVKRKPSLNRIKSTKKSAVPDEKESRRETHEMLNSQIDLTSSKGDFEHCENNNVQEMDDEFSQLPGTSIITVSATNPDTIRESTFKTSPAYEKHLHTTRGSRVTKNYKKNTDRITRTVSKIKNASVSPEGKFKSGEFIDIMLNQENVRLKYVENDPKLVANKDDMQAINGSTTGFLKIEPGGMKQPYTAKKHSLWFFVMEGKGEIRVHNRTCAIKPFSRFNVPSGIEYSIKNGNKEESLILGYVKMISANNES
ncbi:unnamed protein product [Phaedon cochleariae]|uniref:Mif2/CENP-C cupin domain-containing protein n=1 Tax=Phaedon cochleariae TaxID=80249 RepID=A0A9P0DCX7_PHACE|nr:unnamed protein product [Phaedon cochleariae]